MKQIPIGNISANLTKSIDITNVPSLVPAMKPKDQCNSSFPSLIRKLLEEFCQFAFNTRISKIDCMN